MFVTKADGSIEKFSKDKLYESIKRAGVPSVMYEKVIAHLESIVFDKIPTSEIYNHIKEFLGKSTTPFTKSKYSLKEAIMALGPTGYPFEDFVAKIMTHLGYTTLTRQIVLGRCISHEVDVVAEKNTVIPTKIMVEAKFHNSVGLKTNVQIPMYTKARFEDIAQKNNFTGVMLATNTKATTDAIAYANCVGMKIMSWSYPDGESIRDLVEKYFLYPITTLENLPENAKEILFKKGIILCSDLCENENIINDLPLDNQTKKTIKEESMFVCSIN